MTTHIGEEHQHAINYMEQALRLMEASPGFDPVRLEKYRTYATFLEVEGNVDTVFATCFSDNFVPGLLQAPAYSSEVWRHYTARDSHPLPPDVAELMNSSARFRRVGLQNNGVMQALMARASAFDPEASNEAHGISRGALLQQVEHILHGFGSGHRMQGRLSLRIIPEEYAHYAADATNFSLYLTSGLQTRAFVEDAPGTSEVNPERYIELWRHLAEVALDPAESLEYLAGVRSSLASSE